MKKPPLIAGSGASGTTLALTAACTLVALFTGTPTAVRADDPHPARAFGDVHVLTPVAAPFYPEGIAVNGDKVYVAGAATFATAGNGTPSYVRAYDVKTGALLREYDIKGENLAAPHANSCIAFDGQGRLYVINVQLGMLRLDLETGHQDVYAAPLPPTGFGQGFPLPNDLAFDRAGSLYETDSFQGIIWRIPPGGGTPQIWFHDVRLETPFGPNGIRVDPSGTKLYFSLTADTFDQSGFHGGEIYTLPLINAPQASDLKVFHTYSGEGPDGIAFGRSGDLYVMLATPFISGISVLGTDGVQKARLGNAGPGLLAPYDSPANAAFDKHGSMLVANHASQVPPPDNAAILSVFVDDKGLPLERPEFGDGDDHKGSRD